MIDHVRVGAKKVGGISELHRLLGMSHPALYQWTRVPAERVLKFEEETGISRHKLRPDIYGATSD